MGVYTVYYSFDAGEGGLQALVSFHFEFDLSFSAFQIVVFRETAEGMDGQEKMPPCFAEWSIANNFDLAFLFITHLCT